MRFNSGFKGLNSDTDIQLCNSGEQIRPERGCTSSMLYSNTTETTFRLSKGASQCCDPFYADDFSYPVAARLIFRPPDPPPSPAVLQSQRVDLRHILSSLETTACRLLRSKVIKSSPADTSRFIEPNILYSAGSNFIP